MWIHGAQEYRFILERDVRHGTSRHRKANLVHPSIGEQQSRVVIWDGGRRLHKGVSVSLEVVEEFLANPGGRPGGGEGGGGHGSNTRDCT